MERKTLIKIIVALTFIAIAILLVFVILYKPQPRCNLQANVPFVHVADLKNIVSREYDALINFGGYLTYPGNQSVPEQYLPLTAEKVSKTNGPSKDKRILTLSTDCLLEFHLTDVTYPGGELTYEKVCREVERIDVKLAHSSGEYTECSVFSPDMSARLPKHHYRQNEEAREKDKVCEGFGGKVAAHLMIEYLEYEVDGDATIMKSGCFSTEALDTC